MLRQSSLRRFRRFSRGDKIEGMNAHRAAITLSLAVLMCTVPAAPQQLSSRVSFPSTRSEAVSPDRRFAVVNTDADMEPYHTLSLENRKTKSRRKILEYGRSVEVLWNPESTSFAVNDYAGSNLAECKVFSLLPDRAPLDVGNKIRSDITNPKELASLQKNDHVYYAAVRWVSPEVLRVKVWGHGDENPSGFKRIYTVRLKSE
jgi:hypothetical protein